MGRTGFIREKENIKLLTLYALGRFPFPVNEAAVLDVCLIDDAFGYLEFAEAFGEMIDTGHILVTEKEGEKLYSISEKGRETAKLFERKIPLSVREKAEQYAVRITHAIRRDAGLHTSISDSGTGMKIARMAMGDKDDLIFDLRMTLLNDKQCNMLINGFRKNAEKIYNTLLKVLLQEDEEQKSEEK